MARITSTKNETIARLRTLLKKEGRRQTGAFLVEGEKLVREAIESGLSVQTVCYDSDVLTDMQLIQLLLATADQVLEVSPNVIMALSDAKTPQPIIASCRVPVKNTTLPQGGCGIVLDSVRDPGNFGTILRTAEAFGMDFVLCWDGADPYQPKVVRSTAGAIFRVNLLQAESWQQGMQMLGQAGYSVYATTLHQSSVDVRQVAFQSPCVVVIGNEASGVRDEVIAQCNGCVTIPMENQTESLNASVAASVLMWEMGPRRQRG